MNTLTAAHIAAYGQSLRAQERAPATVEKKGVGRSVPGPLWRIDMPWTSWVRC